MGEGKVFLGFGIFVIILSLIIMCFSWGVPMKLSDEKDVEAIKIELTRQFGEESEINIISISEVGDFNNQEYQTVDYILNDSIKNTCLMGVKNKFLHYECGSIIKF